MPLRLSAIVLSFSAVAASFGVAPSPGSLKGSTELVSTGTDGRLHYRAYSERGDVLPDFSHCGYGGGGVPLPDAPVRETLSTQTGSADDAPRIQAALDRVARLAPDAGGLRGAVLLGRGTYRCAATLRIDASGVVLRGEGDGADGTVLVATFRERRPLVRVGGADGPREEAGTRQEIADAYVPVGATSFTVADTRRFPVGRPVFVVRHGNAAWIAEIGMNRIAPSPTDPSSTVQWKPFDLKFDRTIVAVAGNRVTVDAPLACAIDRRWGGGALAGYRDEARIARCGVEGLRGVSAFDKSRTADRNGERVFVDEDHATRFVEFAAVKDAWARRLTAVGFYHGLMSASESARAVTVEDCASLAPVSSIESERRWGFLIEGQLVLVQRCRAEGARHAFIFGARVPGPNAFVECVSSHDYGTSEPHHRWSVGGLYDNVETDLAVQDRQWKGTGHGWAGANYVVWNGRGTLVCQQPPTAQNFAIGFVGARGKGAFPRPDGWWESEGTPVEPHSLYRAQLADRLRGR